MVKLDIGTGSPELLDQKMKAGAHFGYYGTIAYKNLLDAQFNEIKYTCISKENVELLNFKF